jgi:3-oxoacyl-[acyl-carrier protein] reductase
VTSSNGFAGRTALVTGGLGGIGFAFASELARRGCHVLVTTRDPSAPTVAERLAELAALAPKGVPHPVAVRWDMTTPGSEVEAMQALEGARLHVDILVHAAHVFSPHRLLLAVKPEDLARSLACNVVAPYALARRVCRSMARAGFGRVLFVGSLAASLGGVGQAIYITEKAALEGMVRAFAAELGRRGVLVNLVAPGIVDTEHVRATVRSDVRSAVAARALPGRLATAEEIAVASMGLLDPRQGYATGQVLRIAGGIDGAAMSWDVDVG